MIPRFRLLAATMLASSAFLSHTVLSQPVGQEHYRYGGSIPFGETEAQILDRHRDILSLGINNDWLLASQIDTVEFTKGLDVIATAVEAGQIPGAVVFADRFQHRTMPVALGFKMTDPQKHRVEWDTQFYLQDLTGPLVTVPMTMKALEAGKINLHEAVRHYVPELSESGLGAVTVEMLLRHSSGLPATPPLPPRFRDRAEFLSALAAIPLEGSGTRVTRSPLNFLILAMILENVMGESYSAQAAPLMDQWFGGGRARLGIDPNQRQFVAPGDYNEWLGRLQWGEPEDPFSAFRGIDAGDDGLTVSADEVLIQCKTLLATATLKVNWDDPPTTDVVSLALAPDPSLEGGAEMGLGYQIGRFGRKSFGWDSPHGSSIWILPDQLGYIIYLSNRDHPALPPPSTPDPRDRALEHFARSLGWPRSLVDTAAMLNESSDQPESGNEGKRTSPDD